MRNRFCARIAALSISLTTMPPAFAADLAMSDMMEMDHDMKMPESNTDHGLQSMAPMTGLLGPYKMAREGSGTSWQPDSSPSQMWMTGLGDDWMLMGEANIFGVYDHQGGPRGGTKFYSASMGMLMADRPLGNGTLGLRSMISLDPLMGARGYPLLFATGETANGRDPLVDRQHPHDLLMELAASYALPLSDNQAVSIYAGLPGEPALGPPAFMHRLSGMDNPEAPISHHWLDSTHITYGVVTAGYSAGDWKIEASGFKGREPDQHRWNIESPALDSASARLSYNPTANLSFQISGGHLHSPEQLAPSVDENRLTASAIYNRQFGDNNWATTLAWGQKNEDPGRTLNGYLLESTIVLHQTHTVFGRVERVDESELFGDNLPLSGRVIPATEATLGYIYDLKPVDHLTVGIGGLVTRYVYDKVLEPAYGSNPTSFMLFVRLKLS